jgi:hypothetical protein
MPSLCVALLDDLLQNSIKPRKEVKTNALKKLMQIKAA